nr:hypothetical protein CFP56_21026 [Quercus suber]
MMATERLSLHLMEPGDLASIDEMFAILREVVQPDSAVSVERAATQLATFLPQGKPYASEVSYLLDTCYEMAEQIPYDHASMLKLVTIIDLCLSSSQWLPVNSVSSYYQSSPQLY